MKHWKEILITPASTILTAIETIDRGGLQIALVVDDERRLIGTVTDGDVRRAILRNVAFDVPVERIMNPNPVFALESDGQETILSKMRTKNLRHIPILDQQGHVIDISLLDGLVQKAKRDNWVILMAGGLGSRLAPLTNDCPKPLLQVGSRPLLETIMQNFIESGFHQFFISVNYKAEMIEEYFGDGSRFGVTIEYIRENTRMGTAGALSLLPVLPTEPFFVMNGDLLTKVNFQHLLDFHIEHDSMATMCVREYDFQIPYGVVKAVNHRMIGIEEKPTEHFFVNAGIYVLEPESLSRLPNNEYYDMPSLFEKLIAEQKQVSVFPIREYWIDIGQMKDFERANGEFWEVFHDSK